MQKADTPEITVVWSVSEDVPPKWKVCSPPMGDTQPAALGSLRRSREMNEWQKAGSGLAASNVAFWVLRQRGCIACYAKWRLTRLATLDGIEARSSSCPATSSDVTTGAPQKSKMP